MSKELIADANGVKPGKKGYIETFADDGVKPEDKKKFEKLDDTRDEKNPDSVPYPRFKQVIDVNHEITDAYNTLAEKTADYDELKQFKDTEVEKANAAAKEVGDNFIKQFNDIKDHADWEKVKGGFVLPVKDASDNFKWDTLKPEQLVANANKVTEYKNLGFLADAEGGNGSGDGDASKSEPRPSASGGGGVGQYKTKSELSTAFINNEISQKDYEEAYANLKE